MRTIKKGVALPSPFLPPTTPTPSPCVYTPHERKYVPSHSGGIEAFPCRANARISSKCSQAFFSRLSRSTRCALVSLISLMSALKSVTKKQKAHVGLNSGNVGFGTFAYFTSKSGNSSGQRCSSCDTQRCTRKNNRSSGNRCSLKVKNTFDGVQKSNCRQRKKRIHCN